jgi:hypothetical protein
MLAGAALSGGPPVIASRLVIITAAGFPDFGLFDNGGGWLQVNHKVGAVASEPGFATLPLLTGKG